MRTRPRPYAGRRVSVVGVVTSRSVVCSPMRSLSSSARRAHAVHTCHTRACMASSATQATSSTTELHRVRSANAHAAATGSRKSAVMT